jgi:predicted glycoside hydrolase/deacetylase ChbG (UPF0249 family)
MNGPGVAHRTIALTADDFGMNPAVNAGILAGFRRGLLTGTSLLANGPAAEDAARGWEALERERAAGELPSAAARRSLLDPERPFDLGLHLNLTQGTPLSDDYPENLRKRDGTFCGIWRLAWAQAAGGGRHRQAIEREIGAQMARAEGFGLTIRRVDGHQYVEMLPTVASALREQLARAGVRHVRIAREVRLARTTPALGRPAAWLLAVIKRRFAIRYAREMEREGFVGPTKFFGTAHAGCVTAAKLRQFVEAVETGEDAEIGLHPAERAAAGLRDDPWFDPLAERRSGELAMLVDPELPRELTRLGVRLGRVVHAGVNR